VWQRVFRCCSACGNGFSVVALHVATGFPLLLCMWQRVFRCCSACGNGFSVVALHVATGFPLLPKSQKKK